MSDGRCVLMQLVLGQTTQETHLDNSEDIWYADISFLTSKLGILVLYLKQSYTAIFADTFHFTFLEKLFFERDTVSSFGWSQNGMLFVSFWMFLVIFLLQKNGTWNGFPRIVFEFLLHPKGRLFTATQSPRTPAISGKVDSFPDCFEMFREDVV